MKLTSITALQTFFFIANIDFLIASMSTHEKLSGNPGRATGQMQGCSSFRENTGRKPQRTILPYSRAASCVQAPLFEGFGLFAYHRRFISVVIGAVVRD